MSSGFISRLLRALRLDPTLYREVAAPGVSTWPAAVIVLLAAIGSSLIPILDGLFDWMDSDWDLSPVKTNVAFVVELQRGRAMARALALVTAWPVWAAGLWFVGTRLAARSRQAPGLGQVARAIAFAQMPSVIGLILLFPVTVAVALLIPDILADNPVANDLPPAPLFFFDAVVLRMVKFGLAFWVLVGTFLATREALGLSAGQTLSALVIVGAGMAGLLSLGVTAGSVIADAVGVVPTAFGHGPRISAAVADSSLRNTFIVSEIARAAAFGFDFNLELDLSRTLMNRLGDTLATVSQ